MGEIQRAPGLTQSEGGDFCRACAAVGVREAERVLPISQ